MAKSEQIKTRLFKDGKFEQFPLCFPTETLQLFPGEGEEESARFIGVASVFGSIVDTFPNRTKFRKGAFAKTITDRANRIKILSNHNDFAPAIGLPLRVEETEAGLLVEASLNKTALGQDASAMIRHAKEKGRLDTLELSVGFDALKFDMEEDDTGETFRVITEARLWEISLVNFGADRQTRILEAARMAGADEEQQQGFTVQTLIFPKDKWDSVDDAKKWAKDHDYRVDKVDTTEESWRFRQKEPGDFVRLRTICINPSRKTEMDDCKVKAVGGPLKEGMMKTLDEIVEALSFDPEPQEALVGKILSKKNKTRIQDAIKALQALLEAAEPPEKDEQSTALTAEEVEQFKSELWKFEIEHPHLPVGGNSNGQTYA